MLTKDEEAEALARKHYQIEPGLTHVYRITGPAEIEVRPSEPIKLLEVNFQTVPSGILPLQFGPSPASGLSYPTVILEVTPEEYHRIASKELPLPHGWQVGPLIPKTHAEGGLMAEATDWARAYARQADADLRGWELAERHPESVAAECHKLLLLQMACEKLCKAYLVRTGAPLDALQASHGYIANPLPVILREQMIHMGQVPARMKGIFENIRRLAREIEILNPAVVRDGQRPDNCEYPWEYGGRVISPLDWTFSASRLCTEPAGRLFLKVIRAAIDRLL